MDIEIQTMLVEMSYHLYLYILKMFTWYLDQLASNNWIYCTRADD